MSRDGIDRWGLFQFWKGRLGKRKMFELNLEMWCKIML